MTQYFLDALQSFYNWIVDALKILLNLILQPIADNMPDLSSYWGSASVLADYLSWVNSWVALDWAVSLLVLYFALMAVVLPAKIIIKLF